MVVPFLNMTKQFSGGIGQVSHQINAVVMGIAGAERIFALLDQQPDVYKRQSSHLISRPANGFCCTLPLTIYNTQTFIFAKRFRERFAKFFYTVY